MIMEELNNVKKVPVGRLGRHFLGSRDPTPKYREARAALAHPLQPRQNWLIDFVSQTAGDRGLQGPGFYRHIHTLSSWPGE